VLEINEGDAVTIKQIENAIIDRAWEEGWVVPQPPRVETGRTVAVVGAGPAGMAAAQQLRRVGHRVVLFERDEAAGGLVRFGVPDFKIEKRLIERRVEQMAREGVEFRFGADVGGAVSAEELRAEFDAVVLAIGSRVPRDLPVPGRELDGVHFAMDYLYVRNRAVAGSEDRSITAAGKHVVVIGGGDTGADCVGTAHRQGAASVTQLEIMPRPGDERNAVAQPWPTFPMLYKVTSAHEEGGERVYSVNTTHFEGDEDGNVQWLHLVEVEFVEGKLTQKPGTERKIPAQLVTLAMGFTGTDRENGLVDQFGLALDERGNVARDADFQTNVPGVYVAGDAGRGQSLIVWAIAEGRSAARGVDRFLTGASDLPAPIRPTDRALMV
jgi:glutamate synthase (NADPH/NADH) small chain